MRRIFLVGTARSGTTLLQTILHRSGYIYSPPETHFLDYSLPKAPIIRFLWIYGSKERQQIASTAQKIGLAYSTTKKPGRFAYPRWLRHLNAILDDNAKRAGYQMWLEKTPSHLLFAPDLLRYTDSQIILNYREAKNNVAALYQASKDHPAYFKQNTLDKAFKRYRRDARIMAQVADHERCFLVDYERILAQDNSLLKALFNFIGLSFKRAYLQPHRTDASLLQEEESWKANNTRPLKGAAKSYRERLSKAEIKTLDQLMRGYKNPIDGRCY